jgi:hypothetical protein
MAIRVRMKIARKQSLGRPSPVPALSSQCLHSSILRHSKVPLWPMAMIFAQKMIKLFRNIGGDISLITLLAYISRDISDDKQLLTTPDFQHGFTRPQFTAA